MIDKKWKQPFGAMRGFLDDAVKILLQFIVFVCPSSSRTVTGGAEPLDARPEGEDRHRVHLGPALGQKGG